MPGVRVTGSTTGTVKTRIAACAMMRPSGRQPGRGGGRHPFFPLSFLSFSFL